MLTKNMRYYYDKKASTDKFTQRTVWTIPTTSSLFSHFAIFPKKLIEPMILASCPEQGTVLDMFMGSGTTALVAQQHTRNFMGCDLNESYVNLANLRIAYHGDDKKLLQEHPELLE